MVESKIKSYLLRLTPETFEQIQKAADASGLTMKEWVLELIHRELGTKNSSGSLCSLRLQGYLVDRMREAVPFSEGMSLSELTLAYIRGTSFVSDAEIYLLFKMSWLMKSFPSLEEKSLERALRFAVGSKTRKHAAKIRKELKGLLAKLNDPEWESV